MNKNDRQLLDVLSDGNEWTATDLKIKLNKPSLPYIYYSLKSLEIKKEIERTNNLIKITPLGLEALKLEKMREAI
jgi:hypothetical protein